MRRLLRLSVIVLTSLALLGAMHVGRQASGCRLRPGSNVMLYGGPDDPDVFLWDSPMDLAAYHTDSYDAARSMLGHAIVVTGGTHGVVVMCLPHFVHREAGFDDAVRVLLGDGPYRGRVGWVFAGDLRAVSRP